jgi:hypothetical protein
MGILVWLVQIWIRGLGQVGGCLSNTGELWLWLGESVCILFELGTQYLETISEGCKLSRIPAEKMNAEQ